jgi:hypothetical protein
VRESDSVEFDVAPDGRVDTNLLCAKAIALSSMLRRMVGVDQILEYC